MPSHRRELGQATQRIAAELRACLARDGLDRGDVAEAARISPHTLRHILAADTVVDPDQMARLCAVLGIHPADLWLVAFPRREWTTRVPPVRFNQRSR